MGVFLRELQVFEVYLNTLKNRKQYSKYPLGTKDESSEPGGREEVHATKEANLESCAFNYRS